ncbi:MULTISPECIES: RagB/SusD family nutrient uptake outer membrane protein [Niastella]|uniref:RagB/SusD family nutrient uptake outer membrane protein n=1 Tax=Niastella soli TaxID=2821487 RepID=A0ABS3Z2X8_9BACT|nr:RagB/SusD family nutrient uptake outer membrane protein [Niastella soli]MBO9203756.1 RagB/SusD family nutrient uptake outer membrane protein [Niastella soli]
MKKILIALTAIVFVASACSKLDVTPESQYTLGNFPKTSLDYTALIGPIYTQLASKYAIEYFRMQELTTDEVIIPGRDGNYDDGGQYRQHHHHQYTPDHANVKDVWSWGFGAINTCNRVLSNIANSSMAENDPARISSTAEVKAMRALFYFFMMDIYGNVPIVDTFPVNDLPATKKRVEVFQFIEKELKAVVGKLPVKDPNNPIPTYAHPTKGMVYALLAKMYLNAKIYTGTTRYAETVAMCDSVIASKKYSLDPSYAAVFAPDNGPNTTETIFAIPYDPLLLDGNQFTRHGFMAYMYPVYGVPNNLSISMSTTPGFYDKFNLPGDERTNTWLVGKQTYKDGTPFTIKITKKDLNASYSGPAGDTIWQLEITKTIKMTGKKPFDVGNDYLARCMGIRSIKYYPDRATTALTRMSGNDMPIFRLADIYLMKAEAILNGAAATTVNGEMQDAATLVSKVRARAKAPTVTTVTLDELLDERARELYWENWRRNDLIRFGKYETEYAIPGDVATPGYDNPHMSQDLRRQLFPIPNSERKLNTNLAQNDGY